MSRQRKAANFGGARVEHMEQHPLALLDVNRLSLPEHSAVNAEELVADLKSLGRALGRLICGPSHLLQRLVGAPDQHVHRHVATAAKRGQELLYDEEDFAVIRPWVLLRLDVDRTSLPRVGAAIEVT